MYCPKCGTENADSASFCQSCGTSLAPAAQEQAPTQMVTAASQGVAPQPATPGLIPKVPNYLVWAIISLIFFFLPGGIVAVIYAVKVDNLLAAGDVAGAQHASGVAKAWCVVSTVIFCFGIVLSIILAIIGVGIGLSLV